MTVLRYPQNQEPDWKDFEPEPESYSDSDRGFALSGKIMLSAIVVLFFVVLLMVCLHLYARWYLTRARRRNASRRRRTVSNRIIFYVDSDNTSVTATRGLDASVVNSLPVFTYSNKTSSDPLDCAVCLCEFEENESGRVLPKCNHSFHVECIDMWFHSHSTCPMCRAPVELCLTEPENRAEEVVLTVNESNVGSNESGSGSGSCSGFGSEEQVGTSVDLGRRSKPTQVDIPRRNPEDLETELTRGNSPATQSFRSPMSRMLSFTRMLSRDRRTSANEPDIECGNSSKDQTQCDSVATQ